MLKKGGIMLFIVLLVALILICLIFVVYKKYKVIENKLKDAKEELNQKNELIEKQNSILNQLTKEWEIQKVFSDLVKQSPNAIMLMDNDGNILWINEGFTKMYEYTYSEFVKALGKNYRQTSFSPNVEDRIQYIKKYKKPYRYEALNITKTGKKLWTQTALVPVLDEQGEVTNMVTIDTDIHQRITKSDGLVKQVDIMIDNFENVNQKIENFRNELEILYNSIDKMYVLIEQTDQILTFIKEISEKIKILGINASIEAHVAGDFGKGFRIIANEIVNISHHILERINQISNIFTSIRKQQIFMLGQKKNTSETYDLIMNRILNLKRELKNIEYSIEEFKSMA